MGLNSDLLRDLAGSECQDSSFKPHENPLVLSKAKGSILIDAEGRSYVDLCAGFGALPFGHNPDFILQALEKDWINSDMPMIAHGMGDVYPSEAKVSLLGTLLDLLPATLDRASLSLSGAGAVEYALKTAHLFTGKSGYLAFKGAYHGLDLGVLPTTSRIDFREPFSKLSGVQATFLPYGASSEQISAAIHHLEETVGFAGMVVEPIQGRAGVVVPPEGWLAGLKMHCEANSGLLIYDEVFTGLGRTGRMSFAKEYPCDLLCLGKALGGGMPLSACVGPKKVMDAWPENQGESIHTGTFFGHPLSCRIGDLTLRQMQKESLAKRSKELGETVRKTIVGANNPAIASVRGDGLMIGMEFKDPKVSHALFHKLREEGIVVLPSGPSGQVLSLTPALNIPEPLLLNSVEQILRLAASF